MFRVHYRRPESFPPHERDFPSRRLSDDREESPRADGRTNLPSWSLFTCWRPNQLSARGRIDRVRGHRVHVDVWSTQSAKGRVWIKINRNAL
jgi:hypothetical protein